MTKDSESLLKRRIVQCNTGMSCVQNPTEAELLYKLREERAAKANLQGQTRSETTCSSASSNQSDIHVTGQSSGDSGRSC
jgi:hypothetical protein